jgi:hypothetical protein
MQTNDIPDVSHEKSSHEDDLNILKCGTELNNEPEHGENDVLCKQALNIGVSSTTISQIILSMHRCLIRYVIGRYIWFDV